MNENITVEQLVNYLNKNEHKVHELLSAFSNDDLITHLYLRNNELPTRLEGSE